jgi:carnitine O-acetyltransferase
MHQVKNMFGTTRIAASGRDRVVTQWPCLAKHINVIYKDQIFTVPVIGPNGETVPVGQLKR